MPADHSAVLLEVATEVECPADVKAVEVFAPRRARVATISCPSAFRVALRGVEDDDVLTTANSIYYPANMPHDLWLSGVSPGGRALSTTPGGPRWLVATVGGAADVSVVYRA